MSIGPLRPESLIGHVIAGYELTSYIGAGATGLVFRGRRTENGPEIIERTGLVPPEFPDEAAIKLLAPPVGATQDELVDFHQRFMREARTLKRLDHPNILRMIDYGEDAGSGYSYMTLPYMAGGSLASVIAHQRIPLPEVDAILSQIAGALDYAHSQGVIHRDVKPGNILLDASGTPFLSDFSIVRLLSETATQRTTTGRMLGTPAYMAPEQFDDSSKVGPAADLYGLGMVVYELVTGRAAFSATSWAQVMKAQLQEPPAPPRGQRPDLPEPAEAAILRALNKDAMQRFPSAAAFAQAFNLGLQGQWAAGLTSYTTPTGHMAATFPPGAQTVPYGRTGERATPPRRAPLGLLGAAALLLIVACIGGLAFGIRGGALAWVLAGSGAAGTPSATTGSATTATSGQVDGASATAPGSHPAATVRSGNNNPGPGGVSPTIGPPTYTPLPGATATSTPTATLAPTATPVVYTGDIALYASLTSPYTSSVPQIVADGSLSQQWVCCHPIEVDLSWPGPQTIHRIVVWDRFQNSPDNNQINLIQIIFSNGQSISSIDMASGGPRCADVNFSAMSVTSVRIIGTDTSGTNGLREVEVWATTGLQSSGNTCSNVKYY